MPRFGASVDLEASAAPAAPPEGRTRLYATVGGPLAVQGSGGARLLTAVGAHSVRDYGAVGDGVADDAAAFQAAMDAAVADYGGRVVVPPGYYKIGAELEITGSLHIDAAPGAVMTRGDPAMSYLLKNYNPSYGPTGYEGRGGLRVTGGIWDGGGRYFTTPVTVMAIAHCRDVLIEDVHVRNVVDWHCIELNAVADGTIQNCRFSGFAMVGSGRGASEAVQFDLAMNDVVLPGIAPAAYDNTPCTRIRFTGNSMGPSTDGAGFGAFGKLVGTHSSAAGAYHTDIRVTGNVCEAALNTGIQAMGWSGAIIADNILRGVGSSGVRVVLGSTVDVQNIAVTGNLIDGFQVTGIWLDGSGGTITRATVTGNTIENLTATGGGQPAISLVSVGFFTVTGNTITAADTSGLYFDACEDGTVNGNYMRDCATQGISLAQSRMLMIQGNRVMETGESGILIASSSYDNMVTGNYFKAASRSVNGGRWAVRLSNSANNGNVITGNFVAKAGSGNEAPAAIGFDGSNPAGCVVVGNVLRGWGTGYGAAITTNGAAILDDIAGTGQANTVQA